jgi:hypothetical protein
MDSKLAIIAIATLIVPCCTLMDTYKPEIGIVDNGTQRWAYGEKSYSLDKCKDETDRMLAERNEAVPGSGVSRACLRMQGSTVMDRIPLS